MTTNVTKERYFGDLAKNLSSTKKAIYRPAAEVLGMALNYYNQRPNSEMLELVLEIVVNKMKDIKTKVTLRQYYKESFQLMKHKDPWKH